MPASTAYGNIYKMKLFWRVFSFFIVLFLIIH